MASELSVRKRQHDPTAGTAIKQLRAQLDDFLQTEEEGRRVISPKTEDVVRGLIQRLDEQIENPDFRKETNLVREVREKVSGMHNRIETDRAYEPAFRKLEELIEVQFHLRYGDYLALHTSHMRRASDLRNNSDNVISSPKSTTDESASNLDELRLAFDDFIKLVSDEVEPAYDVLKPVSDELKPAPRAVKKEAWQFFLRESWSAIYERLLAEDVFVTIKQFPSDPTADDVPLVRLLQMIAVLTKQNVLDVAKIIGAYVDRNRAARGRLQLYINNRDAIPLANYFSDDLKALSKPPRNCTEKVPIIKAAILFVSQLFFKEFDWDDERQQVTSCIPDPAFSNMGSPTVEKRRLKGNLGGVS
ncbi:hypothetical protein HDV63DRAFT_413956 [Trichoderma sp. SZMC 28014]